MLLRLGSGVPTGPATGKIMQVQEDFILARTEFHRVRRSPERDELAADGRSNVAIARQNADRLQAELYALSDPTALGAVAVGMREAATVGDTEVRIRGEAEKCGPLVPRGFLGVVQYPGQPQVNPNQSGRLELAEWLSSDQNPLTSRVMANRIWQHLFGRGLVTTVDNFGVNGDLPSHPELLDHLATRFVQGRWSVKSLVRAIVLSRTYQLGCETTAAHLAADPANRLVWRHSPRRLDAEEIRDAILAATGELDLARPEGSPVMHARVIDLANDGPVANRLLIHARFSRHRSVYLPLVRGITPAALDAFDFPNQGMVTGRRDQTTVTLQALYMLNDPFVRRQSLALAERLLHRARLNDVDRIQSAYRRTLGRSAGPHEVNRAKHYLWEYEKARRALPANAVAASPTIVQTAGTESPANEVIPIAEEETPRVDPSIGEGPIAVRDARTAAWASFCQALFGAAEFRYLR